MGTSGSFGGSGGKDAGDLVELTRVLLDATKGENEWNEE